MSLTTLSPGGLMAVGAGALLVTAMTTSPVPPASPADCELTFEPHTVVAGSEALHIPYKASVEIEAPDALIFQGESGLTGGLIEDQPQHIRVDPAKAVVGEWVVTLVRAELPICAGTLHVSEST